MHVICQMSSIDLQINIMSFSSMWQYLCKTVLRTATAYCRKQTHFVAPTHVLAPWRWWLFWSRSQANLNLVCWEEHCANGLLHHVDDSVLAFWNEVRTAMFARIDESSRLGYKLTPQPESKSKSLPSYSSRETLSTLLSTPLNSPLLLYSWPEPVGWC